MVLKAVDMAGIVHSSFNPARKVEDSLRLVNEPEAAAFGVWAAESQFCPGDKETFMSENH